MYHWIERDHATYARSISGKTDFYLWNDAWSGWSSGLSHLNFYLCGYLNDWGYKDNFQTVTELIQAIGKEIRSIDSKVTKPSATIRKKWPRIASNHEVHTLKIVVFEN